MPRIKRRSVTMRRNITSGMVFALATGFDGFNDGFNGDREAMRSAWDDPDVRRQVYARVDERRQQGHTRTTPWAVEHFERKVKR